MGLICPLWSFSVALLITLKRSQVEPCGNFTKRTQKEVTHCVINSISPTHRTSVLKREFRCFRCQTRSSRLRFSLFSTCLYTTPQTANGAVCLIKQLFHTQTHTCVSSPLAVLSWAHYWAIITALQGGILRSLVAFGHLLYLEPISKAEKYLL